jgi:hypothetical protein
LHARIQAFAQLFVLEASAEHERCWDFGVVTTPSVIFSWDGQQMCVRRPDWDDATKLVGAYSQQMLLEVRACDWGCIACGIHAREPCVVMP